MSYPEKYRYRTVEYRREGHTLEETKEVFHVTITTIRKWEKQLEHPDAYLREIAAEFSCCETAVRKALKRLHITRKKRQKWFTQQLLSVLPKETVIVMDNASFHRKKRLYELAEKHGYTLIFLPPYSPELNPIEHFWCWLKKKVRDFLPECDSLDKAIFKAFQVW